MLKVVKRSKEYIAIKVPEDCEDVGKFVSNEFKRNSIPLEVTVQYKINTGKVLIKGEQAVTAGDVIVADYDMLYGYSVRVMSRKDFDVEFKPADTTPEVSPTLTAYGLCDAKLPDIEGVEIPDHVGLSESFIAELDKALNDYQQKQKQSSQRTSTPHVRIEFDDIHDIPRVWIDGERIDRSDTGLVSVSLDWHTKDPAATDHVIRAYKIEYLKGGHREGIAQGSAMGPDLFKNDIHAK
ncbi:hypothetical protein LN344_06975 [Lacticaseibacillus paracasei subsp. paracasei]|uniref:hypothetical protein n=1 Tax=Lacticaseibacillus paracasei TaxID=1597 RepID=UPI001E593D3A|nr:hypothetical protein [Lacticaseibacillus paracasei]MCD0433100.1 hypothetical protein [Lacticaseibacillus paracasei subsp. paracasei]